MSPRFGNSPRALKAERLLEADKVTEITGARAFIVEGDHGRYIVTTTGAASSCTCAWWANATPEQIERHGRNCAHVLAVGRLIERQRLATEDPFAGIPSA